MHPIISITAPTYYTIWLWRCHRPVWWGDPCICTPDPCSPSDSAIICLAKSHPLPELHFFWLKDTVQLNSNQYHNVALMAGPGDGPTPSTPLDSCLSLFTRYALALNPWPTVGDIKSRTGLHPTSPLTPLKPHCQAVQDAIGFARLLQCGDRLVRRASHLLLSAIASSFENERPEILFLSRARRTKQQPRLCAAASTSCRGSIPSLAGQFLASLHAVCLCFFWPSPFWRSSLSPSSLQRSLRHRAFQPTIAR